MPISLLDAAESANRQEGLIPYEEVKLSVNRNLKHMPVIFLIDTSGSMPESEYGIAPIVQVNQFLANFFNEVRAAADDKAKTIRDHVDFCTITYGRSVDVAMDWTHASEIVSISPFHATGGTPMCEAVITAGDKMLDRFRGYQRDEVDVFCGAIFNLTDGYPSLSGGTEWQEARATIDLFETAGSRGHPYVQFFTFGVAGYQHSRMEELAGRPDRVYGIGDSDIKKFFDFVRISLSGIGQADTIADYLKTLNFNQR